MNYFTRVLKIFFIFALLSVPLQGFAESINTEEELWTYLLRQSNQWYSQYISYSRTTSAKDWQEPIQRAFEKLTKNSPEPGVIHKWAIINDSSFNAACFPGGEIIINQGALAFLDKIIKEKMTFKSDRVDSMSLSQLREELIAPIIAHELGHYYNRHMLAFLKRKWQIEKTAPETLDLSLMRYSQKNEFEADYTGYLLLGKAGYDPNMMIQTLQILNLITEEHTRYEGSGFNVYFLTHPTPNMRLSVFSDLVADYHKEAASLEQAFSDIQLGINLYHALQSIEEALDNHPENIYLMTEKAIALHKIWISTVSLYDLKLRGIIETPLFYNKMVYDKKDARAPEKKLPGDVLLWKSALENYEEIIDKAQTPGILSNYALLLCYSPDKEHEEKAKKYARKALRGSMEVSQMNNLAVVMFLINEKEEAIKILKDLALQYDKQYSKLSEEAKKERFASNTLKELEKDFFMYQAANKEYVLSDFTPLLNLASAYWFIGKEAESKAAAFEYLNRYETTSDWAKWLKALTNTTIPASDKNREFSIRGVSVNDGMESLVRNWGKPSSITERKDSSFTEIWLYKDFHAEVTIEFGTIMLISLKEDSPAKINDAFSVGASRQQIEKITGESAGLTRTHTMYQGKQNLAVHYILGIAVEIVLYPAE